jgi:RNA polymerase sigma factor (sigma-70 family)
MHPDDPLAPLATRALAGDRSALGALCHALQGPLYRLALRTLGSTADAEDATQEVLIQIVTHLSQFRGESRLLTWSYTIATRHLLRRPKGNRETPVDLEQMAAIIDLGLSVTQPGAQPEGEVRVLEREVRLACTQNMLFALSRDERVAVLLVEVLGASDVEAAQMCEVTPEALRQRLSRARAKMRPVLEERCGLIDASKPCRCDRQANAKQQLAPIRRHWTSLPLADEVAQAHEQLGQLRRLQPIFGTDPPIAPPERLWEGLVERFPALFG